MKAALFSILLALSALLAAGNAPASAQTASVEQTYRLGAGDKVHVNIFGQPELSGDFVVDTTASFSCRWSGK